VLRSGGVYTSEWVAKLQRGVARHLTIPHRFVCFSDVDVPCERIPLLHDWPGWWSKIELFTNPIEGVTLYFDLDTVIVGSLDAIASHPHTFTMAHEFYRPSLLCSTAMAWSGDHSYIAKSFAQDPEAFAYAYDTTLVNSCGRIGDQAFIEDALDANDPHGFRDTFRDLFGERSIASYKVHNCQDAPPADAAAVAFHGSPKPHQISDGWVPASWK
jgi:hypothetical protein